MAIKENLDHAVVIRADMEEEELKVLFALEGHVAPYRVYNERNGTRYDYATWDALAEDFRRKVWFSS